MAAAQLQLLLLVADTAAEVDAAAAGAGQQDARGRVAAYLLAPHFRHRRLFHWCFQHGTPEEWG